MAKVTLHKEDDPLLEAATKRARSTFRYFWREMSWEYRRIIPGLELAAFKVAFIDDEQSSPEFMWVNEVMFDGYNLEGRLLNQPNWLTSIKAGDPVKVPRKALVDWMYATNSTSYGGFTVQAIRKQMGSSERKQHDEAWGLDFGDPDKVHVVPPDWYSDKKPGMIGRLLGGKPEPISEQQLQATEHPMAANMADSLKEFFQKDPGSVNTIQDDGLNMLHHLALSGTATGVSVALQCGGDVNGKSKRGHTPLQFAKSMGWKRAAALLQQNGGK